MQEDYVVDCILLTQPYVSDHNSKAKTEKLAWTKHSYIKKHLLEKQNDIRHKVLFSEILSDFML